MVGFGFREPIGGGSGNLGTPWERMQRVKATAVFCGVVAAGLVDEVMLATPGEPPPPPQPAASSDNAAAATTEGRISGWRQHMIGFLWLEVGKAHHPNMNDSALSLRGG
jgi:hypothetical protein